MLHYLKKAWPFWETYPESNSHHSSDVAFVRLWSNYYRTIHLYHPFCISILIAIIPSYHIIVYIYIYLSLSSISYIYLPKWPWHIWSLYDIPISYIYVYIIYIYIIHILKIWPLNPSRHKNPPHLTSYAPSARQTPAHFGGNPGVIGKNWENVPQNSGGFPCNLSMGIFSWDFPWENAAEVMGTHGLWPKWMVYGYKILYKYAARATFSWWWKMGRMRGFPWLPPSSWDIPPVLKWGVPKMATPKSSAIF